MKRNTAFNVTENTTTEITTSRECVIGKQKYNVVSHYVGNKNIDDVIEKLAIKRALYEINYGKVG